MNPNIKIEAAAQASASAYNELKAPTLAQISAGNYKKGKFWLHGLQIAIENPQNTYRTGVDNQGKEWRSLLAAHYGYICGTIAADGDPIDCFIGPYPQSDYIFVINQNVNGTFDEHKVMIGFVDKASAISAYQHSYDRHWQGLRNIVTLTIPQFKTWLKTGDLTMPIPAQTNPVMNLKAVYWDSATALPLDACLDKLLYAIRQGDNGLMFDSASVIDIYEDADAVLGFDAMVTPYQFMEQKMAVMQRVLNTTSQTLKTTDVKLTDPFTKNGSVNVAMVFMLSDGQTISAFFHNPDTTPKKLNSSDEMISWKWLINKKDVTIVVAPEKGQDLDVKQVCARLMKLAEKNSAAFQRANAKVAERAAQKAALVTEIASLEEHVQEAKTELEQLKSNEAIINTPEDDSKQTENIETRDGSRVVISSNQNTAGVWESRLYVNNGETATPTSAEHKTKKAAIAWANKTLAKMKQGADEDMPVNPENATEQQINDVSVDTSVLIPEGLENEVKTAKGTKIKTGFAVVEASKLTVSHDNQGNINPAYPSELQPRDRQRADSVAWVLKTAKNLDVDSLGRTRRADSGAPIVGNDYVVESGNGRTMAIIEAYRTGAAQEYREWLIEEAATFGISPDKVSAMKEPVLVRVRTSTDIDRVNFAIEANQDDKLAMTATEKAKADANRLTPELVSKLRSGDLQAAENRDFIMVFLQSLGDAESAQYSTTDGKPTKQIYDRVQAALFAHAYNDDRLLQLMADDAKPEIKNIITALNTAAPEFIKARTINAHDTNKVTAELTSSIDLSLDQEAVDAIVKAANAIMEAKAKGLSIEEYLAQDDLFGSGVSPEVAAMALFIKENNRSSERLGTAFREMAVFVKNELESMQSQSLFEDDIKIDLKQVLNAANTKLKTAYGDNIKTIGGENLGGFIDIFTETRGQKAVREEFMQKQNEQEQVSSPIESKATNNDAQTGFERDLDELMAVTDIGEYDKKLDEIAARIEEAGLMDAMDAKLNEAADVLTGLLAEAEKKAG